MIQKGQVIGSVDLEKMRAKGYETTTMIVVTNSKETGMFEIEGNQGDIKEFNNKKNI